MGTSFGPALMVDDYDVCKVSRVYEHVKVPKSAREVVKKKYIAAGSDDGSKPGCQCTCAWRAI